MRIGIEMRTATLGEAGGISQLVRGVLRLLFALHPEHEYVALCTPFNRAVLGEVPGHVEAVTLPLEGYFGEVSRLAGERGLDVLFRAYPLEARVDFPASRQVVLIPDIQHEHFPEFFPAEVLRSRRVAFTHALGGAGAIGTLSDFARRTLRQQPCTLCDDIFLMGPALQPEHARATEADLTPAERALVPAKDFFLYPANLWPHKNHRRLLSAFGRFLRETGRDMALVLTGHPDGWEALRGEFPRLPVRHLGFVRDALLRVLFQRARGLVFFSLYEGFGMPLLEAFDAGTPVACSDTTSLPEVGGDAVLACDPTDVAAMSAAMARLDSDGPLRAELVARGEARVGAYTWERSAENLCAACERVGRSPRGPLYLRVSSPPVVSIVTPSYNQGRFLRRTIDSVLSQTYPHVEYCVVDGGSTDESVEVLKSYGGRFAWVSEPDRGQTDAINKGFARLRGDVRAYLNSDDVLLPDAAARVVEHFLSHPECDMVYGRALYIDEDDEVIGMYNTDEYSFARLMEDCCICQPAAFWRGRIAERVGPFNDRLLYAMDYDYWIRIDRAGGRIEHVRDVLACSRLYAETKTLSARRQIYEEIIEVCRREGGYAHVQFFQGLWRHLCREARGGWPWRLRWLPKFQGGMARLHHLWWNRHFYTLKDVVAGAVRVLDRKVGRLIGVSKPFARAARQLAPALGRAPRVCGVGGDNWVGPACTVRLRGAPAGQELYLAGVAAADMELKVRLGRTCLARASLPANEPARVSFRLPGGARGRLTLRFSRHVVNGYGRRVSFRLEDTNLFGEKDIVG